MHQIRFRLRFCPRLHWGAFTAGSLGVLLLREGRGRKQDRRKEKRVKREGKGGEGREREREGKGYEVLPIEISGCATAYTRIWTLRA